MLYVDCIAKTLAPILDYRCKRSGFKATGTLRCRKNLFYRLNKIFFKLRYAMIVVFLCGSDIFRQTNAELVGIIERCWKLVEQQSLYTS